MMIGTFMAIALALLLFFDFSLVGTLPQGIILDIPFIGIGLAFFFAALIIYALSWTSLQQTQQRFSPRILEFLLRDARLKGLLLFLAFFCLASLFVQIEFSYVKHLSPLILLSIWVVLFGLALDCLIYFTQQLVHYLSPFFIVRHIAAYTKKAVKGDRESDLYNGIGAITEIALQSISTPTLCNDAIDEVQQIVRHFLSCAKSIGHHPEENVSSTGEPADNISYTLFYVFQRFELIFDKAVEQKIEPICSAILSALGKITLHCAKFDMSLAGYPIYYLGKFAQQAQSAGMKEVGIKATLTLSQVAKLLTDEVNLNYVDIKECFLGIITHLETIAKETFRQNKQINITLLIQPFQELKELLNQEKLVNHPDTPVIKVAIERIINEFNTLDIVMRTMPPITDITQKVVEQVPEEQSGAELEQDNPLLSPEIRNILQSNQNSPKEGMEKTSE